MTGRARLLLVDDHHLVLEGLRSLLTPTHEVVAALSDGDGVIEAVTLHRPDVVLLDLSIPGRSGLELIPEIRLASPNTRVLVVTMHADRVLADVAFHVGATGFIPKDATADELLGAIAEVLAGRRFLSERVPHRTFRTTFGVQQMGFSRLTPRQQEIVRFIGQGRSSADIAQLLGLSPPTVTFHRSQIRKALGIESEWELTRDAILVTVGDDPSPPG